MKKSKQTTVERLMSNPDFKAEFEAGYREFLIQEEFCRLMEERKLSVRTLADMAHVSKTTIQDLRTGDPDRVTLGKLKQILKAMDVDLDISLKPNKKALAR